MLVVYADDYYLHVPKFEYYDGRKTPHAEQPDRISEILKACTNLGLPIKEINRPIPRSALVSLHDTPYLEYVRNKCLEIRNEDQLMPAVFIKDTYTPLTRHTYEAALKSANLAYQGARLIAKGSERQIYTLCRPPGHHAENDAMSGYCYLNNAAIAAQELSKSGRVAIIDIDYHHGNGTQKLFYDRSDIYYTSLHAAPENAYPYSTGFKEETGSGSGAGYNKNIPLDPSISTEQYLAALRTAVSDLEKFKPDYVVLSLGFDTYANDPIGGLGIEEASFAEIGKLIGSIDLPLLIVQEGGYDVSKLSALAESFLRGFLAKLK